MARITFGTDGWRAIMGKDFNSVSVRMVAQAIAENMRDRDVVSKGLIVGYDTRRGSRQYAEDVCRVMIRNGITAYLAERDTPTPVVAFEVLRRGTGGAVMITASHNPPVWNGIKYIPEYAGPALPDVTDAISRIIDGLSESEEVERTDVIDATNEIEMREVDPMPTYIESVESKIDMATIRKAKPRIVYDPMHGTGRGYVDRILGDAGCEVTVVHGELDPDFGGHQPEPIPEFLGELRDRTSLVNADLGLATDGDSDRLAVYDQNGAYFPANDLLPLLFNYLVEAGERGGVARSIATTHFADRIAEHHGLPVYEVPVGFKYVGKVLREKNAVIGAEESGGFSFRGHVSEKDGIFTCLKVVEMKAKMHKSLSRMLSELHSRFGPCFNARVAVQCPSTRKDAVMNRLSSNAPRKIGDYEVTSASTMDGIKFAMGTRKWLLIRPSGTESLIRIYAESTDKRTLAQILREGKKLVIGGGE